MDYDYTEEYEYWAMQGRKEGLPSFRKSGRVLKKRKMQNRKIQINADLVALLDGI